MRRFESCYPSHLLSTSPIQTQHQKLQHLQEPAQVRQITPQFETSRNAAKPEGDLSLTGDKDPSCYPSHLLSTPPIQTQHQKLQHLQEPAQVRQIAPQFETSLWDLLWHVLWVPAEINRTRATSYIFYSNHRLIHLIDLDACFGT